MGAIDPLGNSDTAGNGSPAPGNVPVHSPVTARDIVGASLKIRLEIFSGRFLKSFDYLALGAVNSKGEMLY